jgi:hypothetical protein
MPDYKKKRGALNRYVPFVNNTYSGYLEYNNIKYNINTITKYYYDEANNTFECILNTEPITQIKVGINSRVRSYFVPTRDLTIKSNPAARKLFCLLAYVTNLGHGHEGANCEKNTKFFHKPLPSFPNEVNDTMQKIIQTPTIKIIETSILGGKRTRQNRRQQNKSHKYLYRVRINPRFTHRRKKRFRSTMRKR